jgi:hypothetical protein
MSNATAKTQTTVAGAASSVEGVGVSIRTIARDKDSKGSIKRGDSYLADPRRLVIEHDYNIRWVKTAASRQQIDEIKKSIKAFIAKKFAEKLTPSAMSWELGFKELFDEISVVTTEDKRLKVYGGYHRTTAILELIAEGYDIPFVHINAHKMTEREATKAQLRTDHGLRFTALDKARGYSRLADDGMTFDEIADEVGNVGEFKSDAARVEQLVLLGRADVRIHEMIACGKLDAEDAIVVLERYIDNPHKAYVLLTMRRSSKTEKWTPLQKAVGCTRLADECGMGFREIAQTTADLFGEEITVQRIEQLVLLGRADARIHELVERKQVTADAAIEVIRQHRDDPAKAYAVILERVKEGGSARVGRSASAMPKKMQESVVSAIRTNAKALQTKLADFKAKHGDDWGKKSMSIELPAEMIAELLERQAAQKAG